MWSEGCPVNIDSRVGSEGTTISTIVIEEVLTAYTRMSAYLYTAWPLG